MPTHIVASIESKAPKERNTSNTQNDLNFTQFSAQYIEANILFSLH